MMMCRVSFRNFVKGGGDKSGDHRCVWGTKYMYTVGKIVVYVQQGVGARSAKLMVICVKTLDFRQLS